MSLSVGIVGLPNSGKSTLFNSLLKRQVANVAAYPFTTIEPNVGVVAVPDERLKKLAEMIKPEKVTPAVVKFIDIAGLVKNAHQGEGLGNQFLAKIREVDAIVQVVRGFKDESVSHYYGSLDPQRDKEIIDIELALGEIKKPTLYLLNQDEVVPREGFLVVNAKTGEGVEDLIQAAYQLLSLITFYTIKGGKEVAGWSLKKGASAFEAAAKVHTEMAKGFIKAEVIGYEELMVAGGWQEAKAKGGVRLEGRDYLVQDGDVIEFKFGQ
jgi:small GTP-binding protein